MNWGSPAEFFAMGGYALYVWGSFGLTALFVVIEPVLVRKRRAAALESLRREVAANKESQ
ncbi:Heme exporter protein D [Georgfuchsia toluolica]|uniref:Heme exporter protein D n=1 Tax=Georgfuchsia toluolica TaxID=424218 RepID=A0A916J1I6_9PROT|nr:heme exporter protein CcmD [Georgfuchsia toluolica]CAG4882415.1 Heme exporter protein D [Georgfuchsia toluolica]